MSMTFTKLFSSITASTIWAARDQTRIVWITMLAMADQHGRVWASIPGLANIARVSIEACEEALVELSSPDKYSRTKDFDGRRIEEIDGGWRLLNHAKYRAIRDEESIKESKRRYINSRREAERKAKQGVEGVEGVEQCRTDVDRGRANTEAEAETKKKNTRREVSRHELVADGLDGELADAWLAHRKDKRAKLTPLAWDGLKREAAAAGWSLPNAVRKAMERNWTTFEASWVTNGPGGKAPPGPSASNPFAGCE